MSEPMLDVVARRAVNAIDRKTSLKILGAATAVLAAPTLRVGLAKPGKKKKNKCNSKCLSQRDQCLLFLREVRCRVLRFAAAGAEGLEFDQDCVDFYTSCCDSFASCDAAAGFPCLQRRLPSEK